MAAKCSFVGFRPFVIAIDVIAEHFLRKIHVNFAFVFLQQLVPTHAPRIGRRPQILRIELRRILSQHFRIARPVRARISAVLRPPQFVGFQAEFELGVGVGLSAGDLGDGGQFAAQCIGTLTNIVYVFVVSYIFFKVLDKVIGMRVPKDHELEGLDQFEVAVTAYPDFNLRQLPISGYHKSE